MTVELLTVAENAKQVERPVMEAVLRAPPGLLATYRHYRQRYGVVHTLLSYAGRQSFRFWQFTGPFATKGYLRRWLEADGIKIVNLGGGNVLSARWLTADIVPRADVYMNITKPLPLPDESVDAVYSEEVIEHISLDLGWNMLRECYRVLKPGGWIRITTPNLEYFVNRAFDVPEGVQEINDIFYKHDHRHIYSKGELSDMLRNLGFVNLNSSAYRDPYSRLGYLDSHPERCKFAPPEWSQFWEAQKPSGI